MVKASKRNGKTNNSSVPSTDPSTSLEAAPKLGKRVLNVLNDTTDLRDRIYEPALLDLALVLEPPETSVSQ